MKTGELYTRRANISHDCAHYDHPGCSGYLKKQFGMRPECHCPCHKTHTVTVTSPAERQINMTPLAAKCLANDIARCKR